MVPRSVVPMRFTMFAAVWEEWSAALVYSEGGASCCGLEVDMVHELLITGSFSLNWRMILALLNLQSLCAQVRK